MSAWSSTESRFCKCPLGVWNYDNIALIFKECSEHLSIPLSILFNKSFQSGVLPYEWRITFVAPIHKKGSHQLASNYRPVSLTSTVVKVMESIVKTNVLEHLTSNNLLTCHQFGF